MIEPKKKVVLFPIEIVSRELDFRLLLGAYCARADTQIIIGKQTELRRLALRLHSGLFVGKNLTSWRTTQETQEYKNYKAREFRVIHLHEEGAIYEGGPKDWERTVHEVFDVTQIEAEDYVCAWGEFQAKCYRTRKPRCLQHIVVTGHPRFSLCSPKYRSFYEPDVRALKERHGKFILFNTNFFWNNAKGMDFSFRWYKVKPADRERRTFYIDQFCTSASKWTRFIQLINYLSDHFPEFQIIVRPHPAENIHYYTTLLQYVPRVTVARAGGVQSWLLASEAVIHDGCTTAIEAHIAGAKVVNFRPVGDERFDILLPNLVGVSCATESEVEQALRRLLSGDHSVPDVTPENAARIQELIDNFGSHEDAFEKIARIVHQVLDEIEPTRVAGAMPVLARHRIKDALWRLLQPLDPTAWQRRFGKRDRGYEKFPPLQRRDIEEKIRLIRQITGRPVRVRFQSSRLLSMFLDN